MENKIQFDCVTWFNKSYPQFRKLLFHVPNEQSSPNPARISQLASIGLVKGVSDLILLVPNSQYHGACIEMKSPTGRISEHQQEFGKRVTEQGYLFEVCRSLEEFQGIITSYMALNSHSVAPF